MGVQVLEPASEDLQSIIQFVCLFVHESHLKYAKNSHQNLGIIEIHLEGQLRVSVSPVLLFQWLFPSTSGIRFTADCHIFAL